MFQQILTGLLAGFGAQLTAAHPAPLIGGQGAAELSAQLQPGDLLFKGASTAVWTQMASQWSHGDTRWGHVGMIICAGTRTRDADANLPAPAQQKRCSGDVLVVHADTGPDEGEANLPPGEVIGEVRAVSLDEFLGEADEVGLFRLMVTPEQRARMTDWAAGAAMAHTPFDRGYSLDSENSLYCTELIWRAMSAALGRDTIPQKSRSMGRVYVALSDLSLHPLAEEVLVVDARK